MAEHLRAIAKDVFTLLDTENRGKLSYDAILYFVRHAKLSLTDNEVLNVVLSSTSDSSDVQSSGAVFTFNDDFVNLFSTLCEASACPAGRAWQALTDDQLQLVFALCMDDSGKYVNQQTMLHLLRELDSSGENAISEELHVALQSMEKKKGSSGQRSSSPLFSNAAVVEQVVQQLRIPLYVTVHDFYDCFRRGWPHLSKAYLVSALLRLMSDDSIRRRSRVASPFALSIKSDGPRAQSVRNPSSPSLAVSNHMSHLSSPLSPNNRAPASPPIAKGFVPVGNFLSSIRSVDPESPSIGALINMQSLNLRSFSNPEFQQSFVGDAPPFSPISNGSLQRVFGIGSSIAEPGLRPENIPQRSMVSHQPVMPSCSGNDPLEMQVEVLKTTVLELQDKVSRMEGFEERNAELETENSVLHTAITVAEEEYRICLETQRAAEHERDALRHRVDDQEEELDILRDQVRNLRNVLEVSAFEMGQQEHMARNNSSSSEAQRAGIPGSGDLSLSSPSGLPGRGPAASSSAGGGGSSSGSNNAHLIDSLVIFLEKKEKEVEQREESVREELRHLKETQDSLAQWESMLQKRSDNLVVGEVEAKHKWAQVFHGDERRLQNLREQLELKELDLVQREAEVRRHREQLAEREQQLENISLPERQRRTELLRQIEMQLAQRERLLRGKERTYLDSLLNAELESLRNENRLLLMNLADLRQFGGGAPSSAALAASRGATNTNAIGNNTSETTRHNPNALLSSGFEESNGDTEQAETSRTFLATRVPYSDRHSE